jgi:hypothetical protein
MYKTGSVIEFRSSDITGISVGSEIVLNLSGNMLVSGKDSLDIGSL